MGAGARRWDRRDIDDPRRELMPRKSGVIITRRRAALATFGAIFALALPSAASASEVHISAGDNLFLEAAPGEDNDVKLQQNNTNLVVTDEAGLTANAGCAQVDAKRATCPLADFTTAYVVVDDGDNEVDAYQDHPVYISGATATQNNFHAIGDGDTTMIGGPGPDVLHSSWSEDYIAGNGGPDQITTGSLDDEIHGGDGNDVINPGDGDDEIEGDADLDVVNYSARIAPLDISLDNNKNDGAPGELDNVHDDVERVLGGSGADDLNGSPHRDILEGNGGNDRISTAGGNDDAHGGGASDEIELGSGVDFANGGGGPDEITGDGEGDLLYGGDGNDEVNGAQGDDQIAAGPGHDDVNGGIGDDEMQGGTDDDKLAGGQGADEFNGGAGNDTVTYAGYTVPLTIDLDGSTYDDGAENEGDSIDADVENATGGTGPDKLTGNAQQNVLIGAQGNDTLTGGANNDTLIGASGSDSMLSKDGLLDIVDCGTQVDTTDADPVDQLTDCDPVVTPPTPPTTPKKPVTPQTKRPKLVIGPGRVRVGSKRVARLTVRCPVTAKAACTGTLRLQRKIKGKTRKLGSRKFNVAVGAKRTVRIKLRRKDAKRVSRRPLKVKAVGRARNAQSGAASTTRKVTLKRRATR
jgi:Ca2+-binding RTX toxin-like protein